MSIQLASFGYHDVTDDPTESGFQRNGALPFKLSTALFREHLDRIGTLPSAPVLVDAIDFGSPGGHLLLTFDDGGKSALRVSDQLCRRGWRAHFFITTSLIGRRTFLGPSDIKHLRSCGHLIGSHSHNHPSIFRELDTSRMIVEWRQSCDILAQLLGEPCLAASVPGGEISPAVLRSADAARLRYLFTSEPRLAPEIVGGCRVLGRFCPKWTTSADEIAELASFRGWTGKLFVRQLKALARRSVPPLYRLYVRQSTREWQGVSR